MVFWLANLGLLGAKLQDIPGRRGRHATGFSGRGRADPVVPGPGRHNRAGVCGLVCRGSRDRYAPGDVPPSQGRPLDLRLGPSPHALQAGGFRLLEAPGGRAVMLAGNALVVGLGLGLTTISPALSLFVFIALGAVYANWNALHASDRIGSHHHQALTPTV